jgi:hypothetical protein
MWGSPSQLTGSSRSTGLVRIALASTLARLNRSAGRARIVLAVVLAGLLGLVSQPGAVPVGASAPTDDAANRLRVWHFAEGNSRNDFQTFFTLLNLADQPASVTASYDRDDNIRLVQWLGIPPRGRISLNANDVVGPRAFGASFQSDQDVIVERSTTWGPGQNGETTIGFSPVSRRGWHFAEGTTYGSIETYFVTRNLSDAPAEVTATFVADSGKPVRRDFSLAPRARDAFRVNDLLPDTAFSASFFATEDVVVERTILSEGEHGPQAVGGKREAGKPQSQVANGLAAGERSMIGQDAYGILGGLGYAVSGTEIGARTWSFAEGSTRRPYETVFILFNPGERAATAQLRLTPEGGEPAMKTLAVPALGRATLNARDLVPAGDFTTSVTSDQPIIAERAFGSTGDGLYGTIGYTPNRPRTDSRTWYFADGNTTGGIDTYFVFANLSQRPATVAATYFGNGTERRQSSVTIAPAGRISLRANETVPDQTFAVRFAADQDIVVERTTYFPGGSGFSATGATP